MVGLDIQKAVLVTPEPEQAANQQLLLTHKRPSSFKIKAAVVVTLQCVGNCAQGVPDATQVPRHSLLEGHIRASSLTRPQDAC